MEILIPDLIRKVPERKIKTRETLEKKIGAIRECVDRPQTKRAYRRAKIYAKALLNIGFITAEHFEEAVDEARKIRKSRSQEIKAEDAEKDKYKTGTVAGVSLMLLPAAYGIGLVIGHLLSGPFPSEAYDTLRYVIGLIVLGHILVRSNGGYRKALSLIRRNILRTLIGFSGATVVITVSTMLTRHVA
ncbi:hypothetical protein [Pseudomonas putida]|uniref:Transmembrane protein n=1 Tax=Pseudomonas putida TaxID=303 RepID=A0A8I1EAY9_PSEPU|nr:hypothetical protein [Pseudomonas putida]MBI6882316.1 hypothetical protein [Pseudomonas putida]